MKEDKYLCSGSECIIDCESKKYNEDVKHIEED
jgi:hypothetical protein